MDMSRLWKAKTPPPSKPDATSVEQLETQFRKALPQKTSFRQMWQTIDSSEKMKQPRIKTMITTALCNAIESLTELTEDSIGNLDSILEKPSGWHSIQLVVGCIQILGKFLNTGAKSRQEMLKRLDRLTLDSIMKPDYLSIYADFLKNLYSPRSLSELPEDKLIEMLSLASVHCMATFKSVEEGSPYQVSTLKFFRTVLEHCEMVNQFLSENVLKALCMMYAYEEVWNILELIISRLGVDVLLWQLSKIEQCSSIYPEIPQGAIIFSSRFILEDGYNVSPGICPMLFLSSIANFVGRGENEDTLRRVLPSLSAFVDRDPTRLTAEWYYIWEILEAAHRLSKKHAQSETIVLDIISKACGCYEASLYYGSISQLGSIITYYRTSLPDSITSLSFPL